MKRLFIPVMYMIVLLSITVLTKALQQSCNYPNTTINICRYAGSLLLLVPILLYKVKITTGEFPFLLTIRGLLGATSVWLATVALQYVSLPVLQLSFNMAVLFASIYEMISRGKLNIYIIAAILFCIGGVFVINNSNINVKPIGLLYCLLLSFSVAGAYSIVRLKLSQEDPSSHVLYVCGFGLAFEVFTHLSQINRTLIYPIKPITIATYCNLYILLIAILSFFVWYLLTLNLRYNSIYTGLFLIIFSPFLSVAIDYWLFGQRFDVNAVGGIALVTGGLIIRMFPELRKTAYFRTHILRIRDNS